MAKFTHLCTAHYKVNHKVRCLYKDCNFESSVYYTFKAHNSKVHKEHNWKKFKSEIIGCDFVSHDSDAVQEQMSQADDMEEFEEVREGASESDLHDLEKQLEYNFSSVKDANCTEYGRECCARSSTTAL